MSHRNLEKHVSHDRNNLKITGKPVN